MDEDSFFMDSIEQFIDWFELEYDRHPYRNEIIDFFTEELDLYFDDEADFALEI